MVTPLGPKYIPYTYLDPLGFILTSRRGVQSLVRLGPQALSAGVGFSILFLLISGSKVDIQSNIPHKPRCLMPFALLYLGTLGSC